MDDQRIELLRNGKVSKAVNKLAAPAIVGMMVMAIYNFVDTVFVSWIDQTAVGATQTVMPVMLIASAIGLSLGIGGGSYMSRLLGMGKKEHAEKVLMTIVITGLVAGILATIFNYIFMEDIFGFFGNNPTIYQYTLDYGKYILLGYTFMILSMILNNSLRSEGSAKYQMIGMGVGSVLNIILDPIFIFTFKWGISGAAIATTVSNMVSFIILLSIYLRKKTVLRMKLSNFSPTADIYREVMKIGLPTLIRQLLFSYGMRLLNVLSYQYGGDDLYSAIGMTVRVIVVPSYFVFGYGQGFQPVAGYNFGADKPERVMESFKHTLKVTSIMMAVMAIVFSLFGAFIMKIFNTNETILEYSVLALRYNSIGLLFLGVINTVTVFFQALGKGFKSMIMSISRQGLFYIPMILILPNLMGTNGVLLSQSAADILSVTMAMIFVIPYLRTSGIEKLYVKTH